MRRRGWWVETWLFAGFVALTGALALGALPDLDLAVRDWVLAHRWEPLWHLARSLNHVGSANLLAAVCLVLAVPLAVRRRTPRPLLPVVAAYGLSYLVVGPLKVLFDRAAPRSPQPDAVELFGHPAGDLSYPSGHVVNAVIWYQVVVLLLDAWSQGWSRRGGGAPGGGLPEAVRLSIRVAPPVVVSLTVTYLAFHWVTDVLAALALGVVLDRILTSLNTHQTLPGKPSGSMMMSSSQLPRSMDRRRTSD
ncbi:MAG TPA: phosphatase PAP2 family protein [Micromonosporaceae bacterium]|nr:phosphatase PAP2 family protein [Micromonosporaceae bacterium]